MADTILSGDITVYYLDENRHKSLAWSGDATTTYTINQVYSALADLLDESNQMDDGSIMSAQTPVEYTIGIIDAGDLDPWYVTYDCMQHITGGALATSGWTHTDATDVGIVVAPVTAASNNIVQADIGKDVTTAGTDTGTLLEVITFGGTTDYLVIRPDSNAITDSFDSAQTLTCNVNTASQTATSTTGEQIWANVYTIGTFESDTHVYVYQGALSDGSRARIYSISDNTQDWWSDGHIDICVFTRDYTTASNPIIDSGRIKIFARKYSTLTDNFETTTSTTSGGRNPVPIATASDLNNTTGYKSITMTAVGTDDFTVGDEITGSAGTPARAIITQIDGSSPTYTFHYYLIDDPQTDFTSAAETITNADATGSATKNTSAAASQGPSLSTWFTSNAAPTATFANTTFDIDDDGTDEYYGITIDCNQNPLIEVYEWLKYITRNGETTDIDAGSQTIYGEQYVGGEAYLAYTGSPSGLLTEGNYVSQETSGATGIIISHDTTNKVFLLRDTRGTFTTHATTSTLTDSTTSETVEIDSAATNFAANKQSPFGSFAGGTFFGARGVLLTDYLSANENSFQLIPIEGGTKVRPTTITLTVTNLVGTDETTTTDDRVAMFRLDGVGGSVDKTEYSAVGGEIIGAATLVVDGTITADTPGKTAGGILRIRDESVSNNDYRIRFSSWTTSTFTLANIVIAAADAGTNTTTIVESGAFGSAKRGDLVLNTTQSNAVSYITAVVDANTITISPAITGQTTADAIEINAIPVVIDTLDDIYVPLIDEHATASTASASIVYVSTLDFRTRVRNVANATPIKPFEVDGQTTGTSQSIATIRTTDTIYT